MNFQKNYKKIIKIFYKNFTKKSRIIHVDGKLSHCNTFQLSLLIIVVIQCYMHIGSGICWQSWKHCECYNAEKSSFIFLS